MKSSYPDLYQLVVQLIINSFLLSQRSSINFAIMSRIDILSQDLDSILYRERKVNNYSNII